MLMGRVAGWLMIGVAVLMASADAVMALGPNDYDSIRTADVITLLTGDAMGGGGWSQAMRGLMALPAWMVVGAGGLSALLLCRKRHRRFRFRKI